MTARKGIAAVALLAALAVPALSACGDEGPSGPDPALARAAAVRQQAAAEVDKCVSAGTNRSTCTAYGSDIAVTYPGACHLALEEPLDQYRVSSCADDLRKAEAEGTPIPTVTAAPTAAPAPAQQASSSDGIGSAIASFIQLLLGALCVLGVPALLIWGAIAGRRRARAVHRQGAEWQQPAPPAPAPMYDSRVDHDAYDEPDSTPNNPWA
ncbi:hypothetical protein ACXYTP_21625 [Tsukamurella ocularis]